MLVYYSTNNDVLECILDKLQEISTTRDFISLKLGLELSISKSCKLRVT